jgi:hypothetical protein
MDVVFREELITSQIKKAEPLMMRFYGCFEDSQTKVSALARSRLIGGDFGDFWSVEIWRFRLIVVIKRDEDGVIGGERRLVIVGKKRADETSVRLNHQSCSSSQAVGLSSPINSGSTIHSDPTIHSLHHKHNPHNQHKHNKNPKTPSKLAPINL